MRKLGQCHNSNFDRPFLEHDFGGGGSGGGRIKRSACLPPFLSQCSSTALCSAVNYHIMQCCLCFALGHTAQCVVPKG